MTISRKLNQDADNLIDYHLGMAATHELEGHSSDAAYHLKRALECERASHYWTCATCQSGGECPAWDAFLPA